jgi:guanylate kinase
MNGKLIIFSAPSGAGKSTLVHHILKCNFNLEFSISATSRLPRGTEINGKDYYFLSQQEFRNKIDNQEFIEYEEVYNGNYYGTLRSEVERIINTGKNLIFDVDVVGGLKIKNIFGDNALALFIAPPSVNALEERLNNRKTDTPEQIKRRVEKAEFEMSFAPKFDFIIVNDHLEHAKKEAESKIKNFLNL